LCTVNIFLEPIEKVNATVSRPKPDCKGKFNRKQEILYKEGARSDNLR